MKPLKIKAFDRETHEFVDANMLFINAESDSGTASLATTIESIEKRYDLTVEP